MKLSRAGYTCFIVLFLVYGTVKLVFRHDMTTGLWALAVALALASGLWFAYISKPTAKPGPDKRSQLKIN